MKMVMNVTVMVMRMNILVRIVMMIIKKKNRDSYSSFSLFNREVNSSSICFSFSLSLDSYLVIMFGPVFDFLIRAKPSG